MNESGEMLIPRINLCQNELNCFESSWNHVSNPRYHDNSSLTSFVTCFLQQIFDCCHVFITKTKIWDISKSNVTIRDKICYVDRLWKCNTNPQNGNWSIIQFGDIKQIWICKIWIKCNRFSKKYFITELIFLAIYHLKTYND